MILSLSTSLESIARFITLLIIFIFICVLSGISAKYIAKLQRGRTPTGNLETIESIRLGTNQYVQIMRIGKRYVAMAVSKDAVTLLAELSEDEISLDEMEKNAIMTGFSKENFKEFLDKAKKKVSKNE